MKITIEGLALDELEDEYRVDLRGMLRNAIEMECMRVAREVAQEAFREQQDQVAAAMRSWLADGAPAVEEP